MDVPVDLEALSDELAGLFGRPVDLVGGRNPHNAALHDLPPLREQSMALAAAVEDEEDDT